MKCPRCGGKMDSGICEECGFPITRICKHENYYMLLLSEIELKGRDLL